MPIQNKCAIFHHRVEIFPTSNNCSSLFLLIQFLLNRSTLNPDPCLSSFVRLPSIVIFFVSYLIITPQHRIQVVALDSHLSEGLWQAVLQNRLDRPVYIVFQAKVLYMEQIRPDL